MVAVISLNEIVRFARDEIRVATDEICFADEIKSTHREPRFHPNKVRISHCKAIFHPPVRVDLAEKTTSFEVVFSWLPLERLPMLVIYRKNIQCSHTGRLSGGSRPSPTVYKKLVPTLFHEPAPGFLTIINQGSAFSFG